MTPSELNAINQRLNDLDRKVGKLADRVIMLESENKRLSQALRDSAKTYVPVNASPLPSSTRSEVESPMGINSVIDQRSIKPF